MVIIPKVLTPEQTAALRAQLADAEFVDGKSTARGLAQQAKNNLELNRNDAIAQHLDNLVITALLHNDHFRSWALPKRIVRPIYSKYQPGMSYGRHVDAVIMSADPFVRVDLACTLFLNEPAEYDGGELVVQTSSGERAVKLPAGDAVVYTASTQHWVSPVTRGARLVAATWAQSFVHDPAMREILHEMNIVLQRLILAAPQSNEAALLLKTYNNLYRLTAEV